MADVLDRGFDDILIDLVAEGRKRLIGITNWVVGGVTHSILAVCAMGLAAIYAAIRTALDRAFVDTSDGEWLDRLAQIVGLTRHGEVSTLGRVRFSFSTPLSVGIIIPKDRKVECEADGLRYLTTADTEAKKDQTWIMVDVRAENPGGKYNVASGTIRKIVDPVDFLPPNSGDISVDNLQENWIVTPGSDPESDDRLRERMRQRWAAFSYGGTKQMYLSTALEVPGVDDVAVATQLAEQDGLVRVYITENKEPLDSQWPEQPGGPHQPGTGGQSVPIWQYGPLPNRALVNRVQALIDERKPVEANVQVMRPLPIWQTIVIDYLWINAPATAEKQNEIERDVIKAVRGLFLPSDNPKAFGIGENVTRAAIIAAAVGVPGVANVDLHAPAEDVEIQSNGLATLDWHSGDPIQINIKVVI